VGSAFGAAYFRPLTVGVRFLGDGARNFLVEAWPTTIGFKLVLGTIQGFATSLADIDTFLPKSKIFACERCFCCFIFYDSFFFRRKLFTLILKRYKKLPFIPMVVAC